ncbi:hypothetical protein N9V56_04120 [Alphaproteobacteria bacterium]|nr:hypothetical protein [Alphaproteobacteria bacterium]
MAYTSDFRIKNLIKDVHFNILNKLSKIGVSAKPSLRVFDESNEDALLFNKGGLTFKDKETGNKFGSNDAAWIYNNTPIAVIEGTFATERGQFGDGQLNRFSHSLGVAVNGHLGITLIPFKGESYSKLGQSIHDTRIRIKYATIHKGFVKGAINATKKEEGEFLCIDAYDTETLENIIIEKFKTILNIENNYSFLLKSSIIKMENEIKDFKFADRSRQFISNLYGESGNLLSNFSRYYSQNYVALTTPEKRDGHGLFGKCLLESYLCGKEIYNAIFIRLSSKDFERLRSRKQKEFTFIDNSKLINIYNFDDLIFKDNMLRKRIIDIRDNNLFQNRENELFKILQTSFNRGQTVLRNL